MLIHDRLIKQIDTSVFTEVSFFQAMPLVAAATVVTAAGVGGAGVAAATVRTEKNDNDQKNDPAVIAQKVHLFPSLRALNSYYAKEEMWCRN